MDDQEMRGLLGPAYDETTEDQRQIIAQALAMVAQRWPDEPDWRQENLDATNAVLEVVLGDSTAEGIAAEFRAARLAADVAQRRLTGAIIAVSLLGPVSEVALAERLGVTRQTLRKALAKGR